MKNNKPSKKLTKKQKEMLERIEMGTFVDDELLDEEED